MPKPQTVQDLIDRVNIAWEQWRKSLQPYTLSELAALPSDGGWSKKDIMAHITWHEQEMINLITSKTLAGSAWWELPLDERNEKIRQQYAHDDIKDVLMRLDAVHEDLLQVLRTLDDTDLHDPARFAEMPAEWEPWSLIADNTCEHYLVHMD